MYKSGDWHVICDQCGLKTYASEVVKRWDGRIVHIDPNYGCMETRHPQEFVRAVKDQQPLPFTRPEPADGEVEVSYISQVTDAEYAQIPTGTFGDYSPE